MNAPVEDILTTLADAIAERVAQRLVLNGQERRPQTARPLPDFYSEAEVAKRSGLSVRTLQGWRQKGGGPPAVKAGRRVLYSRLDFEAWLAAHSRRGRAA
jgi:helix-turn-helix protein